MPPSSSDSGPATWLVVATALGAVAAMVAAVYFAGQDLTPIALVGTTIFVAARRPGLRAGAAPIVALSRRRPPRRRPCAAKLRHGLNFQAAWTRMVG